jgi:hypothetical protein
MASTLMTESGHSAGVAEPVADGVVVAECVVEVVAEGLELLGPGLGEPDDVGPAAAPLPLARLITHQKMASTTMTASSTSSRRSQ